jgi:cytochrome P450
MIDDKDTDVVVSGKRAGGPVLSRPVGRVPPFVPGHWLFGSLGEFRRDLLAFYTRCAREFGDCVEFRLGPKRLCLLAHPDMIEYVLTDGARFFSKFTYVLNLLKPTLGEGLLTSEGDFWLRQRRLMQPSFQRQRLASYAVDMLAPAQRLLAEWQDGQKRDLHADMMALTLEIVGKTLFGADVREAVPEVAEAVEVLMRQFIRRWETLWRPPTWWPTPLNLHLRRAVKRLDQVIFRFIRERRADDRDDLLSRLLRARDEETGSGMTDQQLRDQVMTIFLAGHETTANALSWTWYLLGMHPEVMARMKAEMAKALQGRWPTPADLQGLPLTEAVFLEAMRLYPPAYGFSRLALQDCDVGGFRIRKGTTVVLSQWVTHRDPRFFPEPDQFRPERWLDPCPSRPRFAYFPFGGGPHICIGNHFAMMEGILILATLAPAIDIDLVPGIPVKPRPLVTLRPDPGIWAVLRKRKTS